MKANLQHLSQHDQLTQVDCLTVAVLTHGTEQYVYGVDGNYLQVGEVQIWKMVDGTFVKKSPDKLVCEQLDSW